ncbi:MAG TPA: hypothetical protein VFD32_20775 [Dehalococcoidia bacterium]|nr:hypothetical protein [Dehalococcoidia bacterium]
METFVSVERLPPVIADAVDRAVQALAEEIPPDRRRLYVRWHGADLWMIVYEDMHPEGRIALHPRRPTLREGSEPYAEHRATIMMLERRLTVGLFSDAPDDLRFLTDMVAHTPQGRYLSHFAKPDQSVPSESLLGLTRLLMREDRQSEGVFDRISSQLRRQWAVSQAANPTVVTDWELLP